MMCKFLALYSKLCLEIKLHHLNRYKIVYLLFYKHFIIIIVFRPERPDSFGILTGEVDKLYERKCYHIARFFLGYFSTFFARNFVSEADCTEILQEFYSEFRLEFSSKKHPDFAKIFLRFIFCLYYNYTLLT